MNKTTKKRNLGLRAETVRLLSGTQLKAAAGGLSYLACSAGHTGCTDCNNQASELYSNCAACQSDVCTFNCSVTSGGC